MLFVASTVLTMPVSLRVYCVAARARISEELLVGDELFKIDTRATVRIITMTLPNKNRFVLFFMVYIAFFHRIRRVSSLVVQLEHEILLARL